MADNVLGNYNSCCRLCLTDKSDVLKNVFGDKTGVAGLVRQIAATLGVKIDASDKISTLICEPCILKVNNWNTHRKACVTNQTKLYNWMCIANPGLHIKEEPVVEELEESDIEFVDSLQEGLTHFLPIKQEPRNSEKQNSILNEDDLPPALTPNPPDHEHSLLEEVSAPNSKRKQEKGKTDRSNVKVSKTICSVCHKKFHSAGNRTRHERNVHGILEPRIDEDEEEEEDEEEDEEEIIPSSGGDPSKRKDTLTDNGKIEFAAGLCLQSKSASPPKQAAESTLTIIEENYILKCKVIITIFHKNLCCCHNLPYPEHKRMITHMRQTSVWFPPYTCYNCLITFNGRSTKMKHAASCTKLQMENIIRLSELRGRDDNKIRLYHNYKCTQCDIVFAFYEDFCDHVYYEHSTDDPPFRCICEKNFENYNDFKQHAFNNCFIAHHCDVCLMEFLSTEDFRMHCVEKHDHDKEYAFFQVCDEFEVLSNIEIANLLLKWRSEALERVEVVIPATDVVVAISPVQRAKAVVDDSLSFPSSVPCISCKNVYSSYHNMIRHLKTGHKFTSVMMQNSLVCPDCGKTLDNLYCLVKHRRTHTETESHIECLTCNTRFETNDDLRKHIISEHAALLNSIAQQDEIMIPVEPMSLKRKRSKSIGSLKCEECGETFGRAHELESHRNTHLNIKLYRDSKTDSYRSSMSEKDYTCKICKLTFSSKQELSEHCSIHEEMPSLDMESGEDFKALICKLCNATFSKQRQLFDHIKRMHADMDSGQTVYPKQCIYCEKVISKAGAYANHILMHKRLMAEVEQHVNAESNVEFEEEEKKNSRSNNDDESDYHTCKRCFKVFTNRYTLKNHMKSHGITMKTPTRTSVKGINKSTKLYWCNVCHQGCQGEVEFQRHKLEHVAETEDPLAMPDLLAESAIGVGELKPQVFSCDICTKYFSTKLALRKHKEKHVIEGQIPKPKPGFACRYCKLSFSTAEILSEHMDAEHNEGPPKKKMKKTNNQQLYTCSICKKKFSTVGALQSHQGWHKRTKGKYCLKSAEDVPTPPPVQKSNFYCTSCDAGFNDDTSLQLHILEIHRNVNATIIHPISCSLCNIVFTSQVEFEGHMALHNSEQMNKKPFQCQCCDKCFSRADTLAGHEKQHHPHMLLQREHKCHLCDRVFDRNNSLAIHLKMHAKTLKPPPQVKIYSCSICQISFTLPKDLRNHIITSHPF